MPNDIQGGAFTPQSPPAASAASAKQTATTPHQSFMTVLGQAIAVVIIAELAGLGEIQFQIGAALIAGLWIAFLINNAPAVFGALTVKRV